MVYKLLINLVHFLIKNGEVELLFCIFVKAIIYNKEKINAFSYPCLKRHILSLAESIGNNLVNNVLALSMCTCYENQYRGFSKKIRVTILPYHAISEYDLKEFIIAKIRTSPEVYHRRIDTVHMIQTQYTFIQL